MQKKHAMESRQGRNEGTIYAAGMLMSIYVAGYTSANGLAGG